MTLTIFFSSPGDYAIEDDGTPGNNASIVADATGATLFPFAHPADTLNLVQETPGVNMKVNFLDTFVATDVLIGSLANPLNRIDMQSLVTGGDVILSSTDVIRETATDAAIDVTAATLAMSAATGIGTTGAIETATSFLEAETTDGPINITNFGDVTIGGITPDISGLTAGATGNITLKSYGSITLVDVDAGSGLGESIRGATTSGDITLTAIGFGTGITSTVDLPAIEASRGAIKLTAGGDITFGTTGTNFNNDVLANGAINFTAGGSIVIDGFADVASDAFFQNTGGSVSLTAGNGISVSNTFGTSASVGASGNAGANTTLTAMGSSGVVLSAPSTGALFSSSGDVTVVADKVVIDPGSGISTFSGKVTIRPFTEGASINLGSGSDPFRTLALSDAELDRISTPNALFIGGPEAGTITVSAAISPALAADIVLQTESDVVVNAAVTSNGDLTIRAGNNFAASAAASLTAAGTVTILLDFGNTDPGTGGTANIAAGFTSSITVTGEADADTITTRDGNDTLNGAGGNDVLNGGAGTDALNGGTGNDKMAGGLGDDTYTVDSTSDQVFDNATEGTDLVKSSVTWTLGAETENLTLTGGGNTAGNGNNNANVITGNSGNNTIDGKKGDDTISGGGGTDTITGGKGLDTLTGNGSADTFLYTEASESSGGSTDIVTDFHTASDLVDVHLIDAQSAVGGNQAFTFIGAAAFSAEGQIRAFQSGTDTLVQFNTTGASGAEMVIVLANFTATDLVASDFVL